MKAISKAVATVIVGAALLGSGAGVAIAITGVPGAATHPAPLAATAIEYAL
jgi:nicotinamide mononucleotide (NMN) deamidase PncC